MCPSPSLPGVSEQARHKKRCSPPSLLAGVKTHSCIGSSCSEPINQSHVRMAGSSSRFGCLEASGSSRAVNPAGRHCWAIEVLSATGGWSPSPTVFCLRRFHLALRVRQRQWVLGSTLPSQITNNCKTMRSPSI